MIHRQLELSPGWRVQCRQRGFVEHWLRYRWLRARSDRV